MRMVTSKWCGSWWLLKKPGKKSQKEQNIYINDSFFCIFQAECQRMAYESRRPHLQSSWVVQGFITFSTESLHRHEVFAASFSALKTHQDFAKCWFFWFLSTKFTIKTYPLGVDVSKFRNVAPLFTLNVESTIISEAILDFNAFTGLSDMDIRVAMRNAAGPKPQHLGHTRRSHEMSQLLGEKAPTMICKICIWWNNMKQ